MASDRNRTRLQIWGAVTAMTIVATVSGASTGASADVSAPTTSTAIQVAASIPEPQAAPRRDVSELLDELDVRRERQSGYVREKFEHWIDADGDGCDTRQEVLINESRTDVRIGAGCRLYGGTWVSRYDGVESDYYSGFDIDHTVALEEAWSSGAYLWSPGTRRAYANDVGYRHSLVAVTASSNRSKSASEPGSWMPPRAAYRCTYVATWVAVKWRWDLAVDPSEKAGLARQLAACGSVDLMLPKRASVTLDPTVGSPPKKKPSKKRPGRTDRRFASCTEAKANGKGPYRRGRDAEYRWYRDGDGDGWVCE